MGALSMNVPKSWTFNVPQRQWILRILLIYCFLNSLWSTLLSCPATVQLLGQQLLVMVGMKRAGAWGGMEGDPSFLHPLHPIRLQPVYPPSPFHLFSHVLLPVPHQRIHGSVGAILPLSIISPHLSPLSLSPDFPEPCCTKLSLRVSWADQRP